MLWINPHTSYYFRSELQMVSEQGLDVYGAVTWGQFFVYQGFNTHNGWMHTSYGGDAIDEYAEDHRAKSRMGFTTSTAASSGSFESSAESSFPSSRATASGSRTFTVYHSHHGPIIRAENGKWIAIKLLQDPVRRLSQSYLRTKTNDYASFRKTQDMRTDTSNNTVYADANGTIAYFHGNFIPKRDTCIRFHPSGRRQQSGHRMAGPARHRGHHYPAESQQRLAVQQQQLALLGRRRSKSETRKLSALYVDQGRESARSSRDRGLEPTSTTRLWTA